MQARSCHFSAQSIQMASHLTQYRGKILTVTRKAPWPTASCPSDLISCLSPVPLEPSHLLLLPQGLFTWCSFCLQFFPQIATCLTPSLSLGVFPNVTLLGKLLQIIKEQLPTSPASYLPFLALLFPMAFINHLTYYIFTYLFIVPCQPFPPPPRIYPSEE